VNVTTVDLELIVWEFLIKPDCVITQQMVKHVLEMPLKLLDAPERK